MADAAQPLPTEAIPGSDLPGPYPVGSYAAQLRQRLREFARVQLVGEVWGFRSSAVRVYFELRDARGALPCSMWRNDFDALELTLADGMRVVVGGGCDYYPGSSTSSPAFGFAASELRIAGEGDLLVALERLRRRLAADGLFEPQKLLRRPALPHTIGVVTGERGKARDDVLAGLRRRGWEGRLVWAFAPVQDRHAAPRIASALRELAAIPEVEVVIVARGGGSLADLFAFCDEGLCRTVALLRVPVIASVGHHTDRTLIDDVAAVSCSTPTAARRGCRCSLPRGDSRATVAAQSWSAPGRSPTWPAPPASMWPVIAAGFTSSCGRCAPRQSAPATMAASSRRCTCWFCGEQRSERAARIGCGDAARWSGWRSHSRPTIPIGRWRGGTRWSRTATARWCPPPPRRAPRKPCDCASTTTLFQQP